jgi:hypothetical protein
MRVSRCAAYAIVVTVLLLSAAPVASAQDVTFSDLRDAVPTKFFDAAKSAANPLDANDLVIGLDTGFDFQTFTINDFAASMLPFFNRTAADTISFVVTAPDGFYISKITYQQRGISSPFRGAVQSGTAQWVVAGYPASLGGLRDPNLSGTADLSGLGLKSVPVSVTVSVFAAAAGYIAITGADVRVEVAPIVVEPPPAGDAAPPVDGLLPLIPAVRIP